MDNVGGESQESPKIRNVLRLRDTEASNPSLY